MTRLNAWEHVRLRQWHFDKLWIIWGSFDMDLMASTASAQRPPTTSRQTSKTLFFYSRYHTDGTSGIDVLAQDVGKIPDSGKPCFDFCFPSPSMVGVHISHIQACCARAVIIVPDSKPPWFPVLRSALVRTKMVATKADPKVLFRIRHSRGTIPVVFQKWGMVVVEVDFS